MPKAHELVSSDPEPAQALPVLEGAIEGIYLSVGGFDRASRGLLLAKRPTHLLLVDYDPYVVMYNALNLGLLKASTSRQDYWALRMTAGLPEWKARAKELGVTAQLGGLFRLQDKIEKAKRADKKKPQTALLGRLHVGENADPMARAFEWWTKWVRQDLYQDSFKDLHTENDGSNYFFNDANFKRLHTMAKDGKIAVTRLDLRDGKSVRDLTSRFREAGIPMSIVDLSNAWWPNYVPSERIEVLLRSLGSSAQAESRVLLTGGKVGHGYTGFSIKNLLNRPSLRDFFLELQRTPEVFSSQTKVAVYQP